MKQESLAVGVAVALVAVTLWATAALRQARGELERRATEIVGLEVALQQAEAGLSREQAAREALSLELARRQDHAGARPPALPVLTLQPPARRGAAGEEATIAEPAADQPIEVRALLPRDVAGLGDYELTLRGWMDGGLRWARGGLPAAAVDGRHAVQALVTGDVLRAGTYELRLTAAGPGGQRVDVAFYELSVAHAPGATVNEK